MTQTVGFLLLDDFALMSTAAAVEPLRAANLLAQQNHYDLRFLSVTGGPASASVGCTFDSLPLAEAGAGFDLVFVVAGGNPMTYDNPAVANALRAWARRGVGLGGISGGAVLLARAGVMANRRFTVHWQHFDALQEESADHLLERKLFVIDRDRFTCAGGSAPLDMMHALIAATHGLDLGRAVCDWFIHTRVRDAADPQKAGPIERYKVYNPTLIETIELMETHLADPLDMTQIARLTGVSLRQIQRLFAQHMGESAIRFYRRLRLELAETLLVQTALPVTEVALATGFSNPAHFSRAFRDEYGITPSQRRNTG